MVNVFFSTPSLAGDADSIDNAALSQAEFFLFLADSVEQEGLLTTPLDLQQSPEVVENLYLEKVSLKLKDKVSTAQSDKGNLSIQKETAQVEDQ